MNKPTIAVSILTTIAIVLFLIFSPPFILENTGRDLYKEWRENVREPYAGVIEVWHIVGFKAHTGSISAWLNTCAMRFESKHNSVFINVTAMTTEEYTAKVAKGQHADIISYPLGMEYADSFVPLEQEKLLESLSLLREGFVELGMCEYELYSLPYMYSGYSLLMNTQKLTDNNITWNIDMINAAWIRDTVNSINLQQNNKRQKVAALSGDSVLAALCETETEILPYESFKETTAAMALCDYRKVGDLERLTTSGKGFVNDSAIITNYTDLAQFIAFSTHIDPEKLGYAYEFINLLFTDWAQKGIYEHNAYGVTTYEGKDPQTGESILYSIAKRGYATYLKPHIPNTFAYRRYTQALHEAAIRAVSGEQSGKTEFNERFQSLFAVLETLQ